MPSCKFALDRTYWSLLLLGSMTLEQLAEWMGRDPYVVNNWLFMLRKQGLVELSERGQHRNRHGMKCGKWRIVPDVERAEREQMAMPRQTPHRSKQDYATPADFMAAAVSYLKISRFTFDFAADVTNAKAPLFWGIEDDSLSQSADAWRGTLGEGWGFLNPPFAQIEPWSRRCWQVKQLGGRIAFLIPASVGANWFKYYVHGKALVLFLNGRLAFIEGKPDELYPKDCVLCLYSPDLAPGYKVWTWKRELAKARSAA